MSYQVHAAHDNCKSISSLQCDNYRKLRYQLHAAHDDCKVHQTIELVLVYESFPITGVCTRSAVTGDGRSPVNDLDLRLIVCI